MRSTRITFTDDELRVMELALRGYLEGAWTGEYDDDHVAMEQLQERMRVARRRLRQETSR